MHPHSAGSSGGMAAERSERRPDETRLAQNSVSLMMMALMMLGPGRGGGGGRGEANVLRERREGGGEGAFLFFFLPIVSSRLLLPLLSSLPLFVAPSHCLRQQPPTAGRCRGRGHGDQRDQLHQGT